MDQRIFKYANSPAALQPKTNKTNTPKTHTNMKLNNTTKRTNKGMTLLELTVVILVLLSLISILFIGARAWKKGSDRAANILNIRNVQQAVRGHMNMFNIPTPATPGSGVELLNAKIVGADQYLNAPTAPGTGISYGYLDKAPAVGELYLKATYTGTAEADYAPDAASYTQW